MNAKKRSATEKCGLVALGLALWICTAAIFVGIVMDTWLYKTKPTADKHYYFGLWRVCLVFRSEPTLFIPLAPSNSASYKCQNIFSGLNYPELQNSWNSDVQSAGLVCMFIAAACILSSHIFFMCGYVGRCCCRTLGKASLPAVIITCCLCQITTLVISIYAHGSLYLRDDMTLGWAYYLIAANSFVTFCIGVLTIIIPCLS